MGGKILPDSVKDIKATNQTVEDHTKKVVQMHLLAKNFAEQMSNLNHDKDKNGAFGECFSYNKIYFGKIVEEDTCVTIEEYIPGKFAKYVNNNGLSIPVDKDDNVRLLQKAECFAHYTYVKSGEKLMVLDIQGSGYRLYDPEIASTELEVEN